VSFEKHLNILDYALQTFWRRKLKNVSVIIVFAAVIFLVASFQLTTSSLVKSARKSLARAPEIVVQKMSAGRQESIPLAYNKKMGAIFGIQIIVPRVWGYYFDEINGANYTVIGINPALMPMGRELDIVFEEGGHFPKPGEAALGSGILQSLALEGRQVFSMYRPDLTLKTFRIGGIFDSVTDFLTSDTLITTLEDGRDLFGLDEEKVTDFCVYVRNPNEIETIAKKISTALPDTRVVTRPQIEKTYKMVFSWRSGFASVCILTALTAFIIFAWDKASGLSPEERREIAILKILGWQTADILLMRFWEGLLVSILAFIAGYLGAFIHVVFFSAGFFRPVLVGWSVLIPDLTLVPDVTLSDMLLVLSFSVLPYLAATVIPAWRSSIISPDAAMH
jgi:ABC-type lipoprotein release transport system permease subunit